MKKQLKNILKQGKYAIIGGLAFLGLCSLFLIFNKEPINKESIGEKFALVAYILLIVGVIQLSIEFVIEERNGAKEAER